MDTFLDSAKTKGNPNTKRAYADALDRTAEQLVPQRPLPEVTDTEVAAALTALWARRRPRGGKILPRAWKQPSGSVREC
ncbi:hypothetical protein [Streptomyces sp. NPDC018833]|uniref:hypothetical protein n=1 Tax=Streptomyces sp. NPDC018833 TaxID=3365053 RepID=UPI0037AF1673